MTALMTDLNATLEGLHKDQERMKSSLMIGFAGVAGIVFASTGLIIAVITGFFGGGGAAP